VDTGEDNMAISPLVNTDMKRGGFTIMLQQFRRAIGVAIVCYEGKHKPHIRKIILYERDSRSNSKHM
jgi:hypothetical protein